MKCDTINLLTLYELSAINLSSIKQLIKWNSKQPKNRLFDPRRNLTPSQKQVE